jgi:hypothetical protein
VKINVAPFTPVTAMPSSATPTAAMIVMIVSGEHRQWKQQNGPYRACEREPAKHLMLLSLLVLELWASSN